MNKDLTFLRDPMDESLLTLDGHQLNSQGGRRYPIINEIPRFVYSDNYSADFGDQWNQFPKTQLDSFNGFDHSQTRLSRCLHGHLKNLAGKKILEAGSGAGRFTEILLKSDAIVHSFDYSNAVEANAKNNGHHENLVLVQADIRKIPFSKQSYDYVICLGVLQHTPNPEESIKSLWEMLKPGGFLIIDHYIWKWRLVLPPPFGNPENIFRQIVLKISKKDRFRLIKRLTDFWFPWHWRFKDSLWIQKILRRFSPVHFYYPDMKLRDRDMYYEWSLLDTHDALTDFYKHRRKPSQIKKVLEEIDAKDIKVKVGGNGIEAFCRKGQ